MVEVIAFLFENYINKKIDINIDIEQLAHKLPEVGFNNDEIYFAMEWLDRTINHKALDVNVLNDSDSIRVYGKIERAKITEEARGLLYFLEQNKMITPAVRELIIDQAMALHINYVGKEEMHWVLLFVMMNSNVRDDIAIWIEKNIDEFKDASATSNMKV